MDDLISRKAAIEEIAAVRDQIEKNAPYRDADSHESGEIEGLYDAFLVVKKVPSVSAVPLDKLCKWLSLNYGAPCNYADSCVADICETDGAGKCYGMDKPDEECWKYLLTKTFMNKKED